MGNAKFLRFKDGRVGVLYEKDGYKKLVFVSFGLDWLTKDK